MNYMYEFLTDCELRGLSHLTRKLYKMFLTEFVEDRENISDKTQLAAYLLRYANPRTRHAAFRSIRTYIRWCALQGFCNDWVSGMRMNCPEASATPPLSVEDFERILAAIPNSEYGRRDKALYACLFYTGARRDAIRLLKREDIFLQERFIRIRSKGNKEGYLPLPKPAALLLHAWLIRHDSQWVFPSLRSKSKNRPIDSHHVSRRIHDYARAAGFSRRVHVHLLRHSFATLMSEADVPIQVISSALMHSDIGTTTRYIFKLAAAAKVKSAVDRIFGGQ